MNKRTRESLRAPAGALGAAVLAAIAIAGCGGGDAEAPAAQAALLDELELLLAR